MSTHVVVHEEGQGTLRSYTIGFLLSIILTLIAYISVTSHSFGRDVVAAVIIGLAMIQLLVQLVFFLHLGVGRRTRDNLLTLLFMVLVVSILVFGSLWIMKNLNYNMPSPVPSPSALQDQGVL